MGGYIMSSTINADTTNGVVVTSDTSGEIELQSNGVTKAKVTANGLQDASGSAIIPQAGKNTIINGDMRINQRNDGSALTITGDNEYGLDRWVGRTFGGAGRFSMQRVADAPEGFEYSNKITVTTTATSGVGGYGLEQRIEGQNLTMLNYGVSTAKSLTVSFWIKASVVGTYSVAIRTSTAGASGISACVNTFTISVANTWQKVTNTFPANTAYDNVYDNTTGIFFDINFGAQTAKTTSTLNSWVLGNFLFATGQTDVMQTAGATINITGVQLEVGTTATDFENRPYDMELARCERYFQKSHPQGVTPAAAGFGGNSPETIQQFWNSGNTALAGQQFIVKQMRANPSATIYDYANNIGKVTGFSAGGGGTNNVTPNNIKAFHDKLAVILYGLTYYGMGFAYTLDAEL